MRPTLWNRSTWRVDSSVRRFMPPVAPHRTGRPPTMELGEFAILRRLHAALVLISASTEDADGLGLDVDRVPAVVAHRGAPRISGLCSTVVSWGGRRRRPGRLWGHAGGRVRWRRAG